jgi:alpha/beta superfamily hydrolase
MKSFCVELVIASYRVSLRLLVGSGEGRWKNGQGEKAKSEKMFS